MKHRVLPGMVAKACAGLLRSAQMLGPFMCAANAPSWPAPGIARVGISAEQFLEPRLEERVTVIGDTRRWSSSPHKITTWRKKATKRDDMSLTQEQLTELFDEDKNGELSATEAHAMAEFVSLRHKEL